MKDPTFLNNPYIVGSPVSGQEMFFGRHDVFEWIRLNLVGAHHDQPLILSGQRRTGKTSVLKQVENGRFGERYIALFIDLQGFYIENSAGFLWELAVTASLSLYRHDIEAPELDSERFMENPYREFQKQWLLPVLANIGEKSLLFLFDEAEALEEKLQSGRLNRSLFDYLRSLVQSNARVSLIFGMGCRLDAFSPDALRLFNIALYKPISYLSHDAAVALIAEPVPFEVSGGAIQAILDLTNGHPYYTQLICHTLFEQWQLGRLDVADASHIHGLVEMVLERGTAALSYIWLYDGVTNDDRLLMSALATLTEEKPAVKMEDIASLLHARSVPISPTALMTAAENLQAQQIIESKGALCFSVELVRAWVRQERPLAWVISQTQKVSRLAEQYATAAQILIERGDHEEAQREYERALREDPAHVRSILGVSHIATRNQQWTEASLGYEKVLEIQAADNTAREGFIRARLGRAKRNFDQGRLTEVEEDYRAILAVRPGHEPALQGLCDVYAHRGTDAADREAFDEAMQAYRSWADIAPDPALAQRAMVELNRKIYHKVGDRLRQESERAINAKDWVAAIQALAALTEVPGHNGPEVEDMLCFVQGRAAYSAKNFQTAVDYFQPLHERQPEFHPDLEPFYQHALLMVNATTADLPKQGSRRPLILHRWLWALIGATITALVFGGIIFADMTSYFASVTPQSPAIVAVGETETPAPTATTEPTVVRTIAPTTRPTLSPTMRPTDEPTTSPTERPTRTPRPTATPSPTTISPSPTAAFAATSVRSFDQMTQQLMSGGTFVMGAVVDDEEAALDELPAHQVRLDPFYIDQHEVTVAQYVEFLQATGRNHLDGCDGNLCVYTQFNTESSYIISDIDQYRVAEFFGDHPVTSVTWYGAAAYCDAVGGRLPTEAEWEYAARSQGENRGLYPWGDDIPATGLALFDRERFSLLRKVGSFPAGGTADGVHDMAGSVQEWVVDHYSETYYENAILDNPSGPDEGEIRIVRGGSWQSAAADLRISSREAFAPETVDTTIGFRCVLPLTAQLQFQLNQDPIDQDKN